MSCWTCHYGHSKGSIVRELRELSLGPAEGVYSVCELRELSLRPSEGVYCV